MSHSDGFDLHARISQKTAGLVKTTLRDQDPSRDGANRPIDHTHLRVRDAVLDSRLRQQRGGEGNQNGIVGPDKLDHDNSWYRPPIGRTRTPFHHHPPPWPPRHGASRTGPALVRPPDRALARRHARSTSP